MYYETTHDIGPGWHKSFKPSHYDNMTWSPTSKHFRSPSGSPQSYRKIIHPEDSDRHNEDESTFSGRESPTFSRKLFKDIWDDTANTNHRFSDRPRLFKRVFKPSRWEDDDDDFERTRSNVRQLARDFAPDFDSYKLDRDFDSKFHHGDKDLKSDIEEEFEKAAGRVHHIPIMVERRLDEMRSKFGRYSPPPEKPDYEDEGDKWERPQVQKLKKNFEHDDYATLPSKLRSAKTDLNKPRAFTTPIPLKWDPESPNTLPIRRSSKSSRLFDDLPTSSPKSVFRSYSETHEDIPKQPHQQHTAAFRSHSDGHCPKTTYVTKISVNMPSNDNDPSNNSDIKEESSNIPSSNRHTQTNNDTWDSHQSRKRTDFKSSDENSSQHREPPENISCDQDQENCLEANIKSKFHEEMPTQQWTSMQQISAVLQNVDDLIVHVEAYNGTGRDKQFRFLDEMLTRCMLRLDDVDTEGKDDVRTARKAAVMQVQSCIEKLELKANECGQKRRQKGKTEEKRTDEEEEEEHERPVTNDAEKENTPTQTNSDEKTESVSSLQETNKTTEKEYVPEDNEQTRL